MDPADLLLTTRWSNGHRIVVVTGEIDICTAPALRSYLLDATVASPDGGDLVVDLSAAPFIDVCGLTELLRADREIRRTGRRLRLAAPSVRVARLLAITHLDLYFELYLTSDAAAR
jgi:anti-sigma B factor antagonist